MTALDIADAFKRAHPKAVDFPLAEYDAGKESMVTIAEQHGYRFAGVRLERAVFTTKELRK